MLIHAAHRPSVEQYNVHFLVEDAARYDSIMLLID